MDGFETVPLAAVKIDEGSYRIEDNGVRCYLFVGTEKALLVDSGFGTSGSLKEVVEGITDLPVYLVNTHADRDHTGRNGEFGTAHMHPAEMAHYYSDPANTAGAEAVWDGDVIDIGGRCFEVFLLPGHTPGSIALLDRRNRIIVTGDSVSSSPVFMFGDARNITAYMESLKKLLGMKDAFDKVYPSHGDFPLDPSRIDLQLEAAKELAAGKLEPSEPPFPIPAKEYRYKGASFFY